MLMWLVMMFGLGFPMLFLNMSLGFFSGKNMIELWDAVPLFRGNGWKIIIDNVILIFYTQVECLNGIFFILGIGFVQLMLSCILAWYFPTIASFSSTYILHAMASGDDLLVNGSAYNDCYDTYQK